MFVTIMDLYGEKTDTTYLKTNRKRANCITGCLSTDLGLEYLGCRDGQRHELTCLIHSEMISLVHRHVADHQNIVVMAASFG